MQAGRQATHDVNEKKKTKKWKLCAKSCSALTELRIVWSGLLRMSVPFLAHRLPWLSFSLLLLSGQQNEKTQN
jgi:hypothetical protein